MNKIVHLNLNELSWEQCETLNCEFFSCFFLIIFYNWNIFWYYSAFSCIELCKDKSNKFWSSLYVYVCVCVFKKFLSHRKILLSATQENPCPWQWPKMVNMNLHLNYTNRDFGQILNCLQPLLKNLIQQEKLKKKPNTNSFSVIFNKMCS